jgi:hypothetical protein
MPSKKAGKNSTKQATLGARGWDKSGIWGNRTVAIGFNFFVANFVSPTGRLAVEAGFGLFALRNDPF